MPKMALSLEEGAFCNFGALERETHAGRQISQIEAFPALVHGSPDMFGSRNRNRPAWWQRQRATFLPCEALENHYHLNIAIPISHGIRHSPGLDSHWSSLSCCSLPSSISLSAQQPVEDGDAAASSHRCWSATATPDSARHRDRRARCP